MSNATANALVVLSQYREQRQRLFPSEGSLQWFLRTHRTALVNAGALLYIAGRYQVNVDKFDEYVIKAGAEAAQRHLAARA